MGRLRDLTESIHEFTTEYDSTVAGRLIACTKTASGNSVSRSWSLSPTRTVIGTNTPRLSVATWLVASPITPPNRSNEYIGNDQALRRPIGWFGRREGSRRLVTPSFGLDSCSWLPFWRTSVYCSDGPSSPARSGAGATYLRSSRSLCFAVGFGKSWRSNWSGGGRSR